MTALPPKITSDWLARPATQSVFVALRDAGFEARAVGGSVRNALIGKPVADIDIATPARPEQTIAAAKAAGLTVVPTGLQHGTVTVVANHIPHEVTTLRHDVETDGRHAVVAFTDDWAADAARRDFTINALYCSADGTVHDPLGGYADLLARRVRFIGDPHARIREDYLRILRFFRFTADYAETGIDTAGLAACDQLRAGLKQLSVERIRAELLKILVARSAADVVEIMHLHGYWPSLLGLAVVPNHLAALDALDRGAGKPGDAILRLAALAVTTVEDARRLSTRLKLSNDERALLKAMAIIVPSLDIALSDVDIRHRLYAHGRDALTGSIAIARARRGNGSDTAAWQLLASKAQNLAVPVFPLRGQDLIDRGVPPGPRVGVLMTELKRAWIDDDFTRNRDMLLADLDRLLNINLSHARP